MLRFVDRLEPESAEQLTEVQRAQVGIADERVLTGVVLGRAGARRSPVFAVWWRVVDGDRHVFDYVCSRWSDGAIFHAGTTEQVATIVLGVLDCANRALRAELGIAMVEAQLLSPRRDPAYGEYAELLAKRQAGVVMAPILAEGTLPATPHAIALEEVSRAELAKLALAPTRKAARRRVKPVKPKPVKPKPKAKAAPKAKTVRKPNTRATAKKRRRTR